MRDLISRQDAEALLRQRAAEARAKIDAADSTIARETLESIALGFDLAANSLFILPTKEQTDA